MPGFGLEARLRIAEAGLNQQSAARLCVAAKPGRWLVLVSKNGGNWENPAPSFNVSIATHL
jgi:hypothetical protein